MSSISGHNKRQGSYQLFVHLPLFLVSPGKPVPPFHNDVLFLLTTNPCASLGDVNERCRVGVVQKVIRGDATKSETWRKFVQFAAIHLCAHMWITVASRRALDL